MAPSVDVIIWMKRMQKMTLGCLYLLIAVVGEDRGLRLRGTKFDVLLLFSVTVLGYESMC